MKGIHGIFTGIGGNAAIVAISVVLSGIALMGSLQYIVLHSTGGRSNVFEDVHDIAILFFAALFIGIAITRITQEVRVKQEAGVHKNLKRIGWSVGGAVLFVGIALMWDMQQTVSPNIGAVGHINFYDHVGSYGLLLAGGLLSGLVCKRLASALKYLAEQSPEKTEG